MIKNDLILVINNTNIKQQIKPIDISIWLNKYTDIGTHFFNMKVILQNEPLNDENNLIKFIRGEAKHGDSENKDDKRLALHTFTFETTTEFTYEFGISANWIVGPNLRRAEGNFDSENAFVHEVNLARGKQRLTFMESVIFHTAYEFWQTCTNQKPVWQPKYPTPE